VGEKSSAKVKVAGINQVAIVVKDLHKTVENYWNILGIGPWDIYLWEAPLVYNRKYQGKPAWAREKIALAQVGAIQLELCQPVEGDSIYQDFLDEHGEGLQHMGFSVDNLDETVEALANQGFPNVQSACCGRSEYDCRYNYIDIKPLACTWEPTCCKEGIAAGPTSRYPDTTQKSPAKVNVTGIDHVAIVVKDLHKTAENYWNILGIGPWDIYLWEAPLVYNRKYQGKPAWAREKIALAQVGAIRLELCQPVEGDSIMQDFLDEHGEGIHHMGFLVDDLDKTVEVLANQGFPSLQSACCGRSEYDCRYNFIDIKPLACTWEPVCCKGGIAAGPASHYPDTAQISPAKVKV
jgi:catechol 2,3-dioxygenase-like lactoylglutathione lyase family enzyme